MMIRFFLISIICSQNILIYSQVNQEWVDTYNGKQGNFITGVTMEVDLLGNLYVGAAHSDSNDDGNILLIKYSSSGNRQWTSTYAGPGNGSGRS